MDFFTSSPTKGMVFSVGTARYTLPGDVMSRSEVQSSGLGSLMRKEGFKNIPPKLNKTEDGAIILERPQQSFELLVEHLLGMEPLRGCPMAEFADKYIALKSELLYWQLPTLDVAFDDYLFYQSAWTDGDCFFPLRKEDSKAFARTDFDEQKPPNLLQLSAAATPPEIEGLLDGPSENWQCWATPMPQGHHQQLQQQQQQRQQKDQQQEEQDSSQHQQQQQQQQQQIVQSSAQPNGQNRLYIVAGKDRFLCLCFGLSRPCVHFSQLPDREDFTPLLLVAAPTDMTLIWSRGAFIHLKCIQNKQKESKLSCQIQLINKSPSWLCVHPTLGSVLSGVEGPVPNIFCFGMPQGKVVRFFPWGAIAINGEVFCEPPAKAEEGNGDSQSRGILEALGVSAHLPVQSQPRAALAATLLRLFNKAFQPPLRIFFLNVDKEARPVTLKRLDDFDIHDLRNEDASGYNIMLALKGALAETRADLAFPDKVKGGKSIFFPIDAEGRLMNQNQVLIDSGGPQGEELLSIALYAEYDCSTRKYSAFETGKKLFDFHRQMFMSRALGHSGSCQIM
ncbi:hypothetical protein, conserved [Eimeria necatrix]|uniref:Uncharacterized protein n=1 Tax=Eimeria necatrix TaxID=51315 RepID=U6MJ13_9EIME|nr:hypothetical protein, conserved [Eimeria necatrix]CDJ63038.1 hypothetical protein, conserved [Eimeria necatrix]